MVIQYAAAGYRAALMSFFLIVLTSCASMGSSRAVILSFAELERNSTNFYDQEVRLEGYFNREWLIPAGAGTCNPQLDRHKRLYLALRPSDNLRVSDLQFHWVSVRGTLRAPRDLSVGGGDLTLVISGENMLAILENAAVESIDPARTCPELALSE